MEKKQIYISGPITIDKDGYIQHFAEAEDFCKKAWPGYEIINPGVEYTGNEDPTWASRKNDDNSWYNNEKWLRYIKEDIEIVSKCDIIYMLNGWEESPGANIEYWTAKKFNLKIFYEKCYNKNNL